MSVSYRFERDLGILYVRYEGHHHTLHTKDLLARYIRDKNVTPGLHSVLDFSRILSAELDVAMRITVMNRLYSLLKHPDKEWKVTYFCPTEVSRSLTSMQQKMWLTRKGVDFYVAETVETLAIRVGQDLDLVKAMVNHGDMAVTDATRKTRKKGLPLLGALSRFNI